jgi:hypothetical protein
MATRAYKVEELTLQDDTDVVVKPLPIGPLRRFMDAWKATADLGEGDDGFNIFVNCSGIALEKNFKNDPKFDEEGRTNPLAANVSEKQQGEFLSPKYKEYLEDVLDIETIYVIMDVAGGIKLNDPKLMEAALAAQAQ